MFNIKHESACYAAKISINLAVMSGVVGLMTGLTLIYSISFTSMSIAVIAASVCLDNK